MQKESEAEQPCLKLSTRRDTTEEEMKPAPYSQQPDGGLIMENIKPNGKRFHWVFASEEPPKWGYSESVVACP
jgi:hypothetical protein